MAAGAVFPSFKIRRATWVQVRPGSPMERQHPRGATSLTGLGCRCDHQSICFLCQCWDSPLEAFTDSCEMSEGKTRSLTGDNHRQLGLGHTLTSVCAQPRRAWSHTDKCVSSHVDPLQYQKANSTEDPSSTANWILLVIKIRFLTCIVDCCGAETAEFIFPYITHCMYFLTHSILISTEEYRLFL